MQVKIYEKAICQPDYNPDLYSCCYTFTAPGCGDERENNVGYHYVIIPGYSDSDYMSMRNSTNAEIQYNAICYLYENMKTNQPAIDYDSLKGTSEYDSTMLIYRKVLPWSIKRIHG